MQVRVHPRVHERHPEIGDQDVIDAFNGVITSKLRTVQPWVTVGIGLDSHNRHIEFIATFADEDWVIWHGKTPPTKKMLQELGQGR